MELVEFIKQKRPSISDSSLKTYNSILSNLHKKVFGKDTHIDIENFNKTKEILNFLSEKEPSKRKTILSALVVITDSKDYRDLMLNDIDAYNKKEAKQEKSEKQQENWIEDDEIKKIYKTYEANATLLYKKKDLSINDLQDIQDYIILSLLGGMYIPPRRSKDYVDFTIKNIDKDKDNYKIRRRLVFNSYKTAKTYGKQEVIIPVRLNNILNKWIKVNPTNYLLFDAKMEKLSNVKLNQRLNKIFGKKAGVNQLRHTYLTHKYSKLINDKAELDKDMKGMGSSLLQEKIYIKK